MDRYQKYDCRLTFFNARKMSVPCLLLLNEMICSAFTGLSMWCVYVVQSAFKTRVDPFCNIFEHGRRSSGREPAKDDVGANSNNPCMVIAVNSRLEVRGTGKQHYRKAGRPRTERCRYFCTFPLTTRRETARSVTSPLGI